MLKIVGIVLLATNIVFAQNAPAPSAAPGAGGKKIGPCAQIESDCKANGYVAGEAGEGKGLWWDCMCPLIAPNFPEPNKNALTVPSDSGLVAACRTHPFGQKVLNMCAQMMAKKNARQAQKQQKAQSTAAPSK